MLRHDVSRRFSQEELDVAASWRDQVAGKFFIFRELKKPPIFLASEPSMVYGVMALWRDVVDLEDGDLADLELRRSVVD